jgi:small-conductance mechanosensitive channel
MQILEDLGDAIRPEGVSFAEIVLALALVGVAFPVARFVERLSRAIMLRIPRLSTELVAVIAYGSRYLTLFVIASLALNLVGVNVGWALALAILFLLVIVLTLRPLVENAAAGFLLKSRPSFAVGDEVQLYGQTGEVLSINARTTVLRTRDGRRVHIPNTTVLEDVIIVLTAFDARRLSIDFGIDPRCDLDAVSEVLLGALEDIPMVRRQPPPRVLALSLTDGAVHLSVRFWFAPYSHGEREVADAATRSVHAALRSAGIELPPPRLRVDGDEGSPSSGHVAGST